MHTECNKIKLFHSNFVIEKMNFDECGTIFLSFFRRAANRKSRSGKFSARTRMSEHIDFKSHRNATTIQINTIMYKETVAATKSLFISSKQKLNA